MAHTFTNIVLHVLFSTKDRARCITPELKPDLLAYMGGILRNLKVRTIVLNGVEDHVHFLAVLPPTLTTSHMMEVLKSNSTGWVRRKGEPHSSYGARQADANRRRDRTADWTRSGGGDSRGAGRAEDAGCRRPPSTCL